MRAHKVQPPGDTGGGRDGDGKCGGRPHFQYSRSSRYSVGCVPPIPNPPAWHRPYWKCYRLARAEDYIRGALHLLREIQRMDGVR